MHTQRMILLAAALMLPALAAAQAAMPNATPGLSTPKDPGVARPADPSLKPRSDSGMVVTPPPVDSKSIATPPKNLDPEITAATPKVDKKRRKKLKDVKKK